MEITRHFTATTVIVHKNKVLLHLHKKLGIWIPVGGHIDRDELPETVVWCQSRGPREARSWLIHPERSQRYRVV